MARDRPSPSSSPRRLGRVGWLPWTVAGLGVLGSLGLWLGLTLYQQVSSPQQSALWPWLGLAAFGMITSLGIYGVVHGWLTVILPGFDQFRAPARATVLWTLAVAVLGAVGIERIGDWGFGIGDSDPAAQSPIPNPQSTILQTGTLFLGGLTLLMFFALFLTQGDETLFMRASVALLAVMLALSSAIWATLPVSSGSFLRRSIIIR